MLFFFVSFFQVIFYSSRYNFALIYFTQNHIYQSSASMFGDLNEKFNFCANVPLSDWNVQEDLLLSMLSAFGIDGINKRK